MRRHNCTHRANLFVCSTTDKSLKMSSSRIRIMLENLSRFIVIMSHEVFFHLHPFCQQHFCQVCALVSLPILISTVWHDRYALFFVHIRTGRFYRHHKKQVDAASASQSLPCTNELTHYIIFSSSIQFNIFAQRVTYHGTLQSASIIARHCSMLQFIFAMLHIKPITMFAIFLTKNRTVFFSVMDFVGHCFGI